MTAVIRELKKKDHKKAIRFAVEGMHFHWYLKNRIALSLYGAYFWYSELKEATQVLAAYEGEALAGILLADMKGEKKCCRSFLQTCYVRLFEAVQRLVSQKGAGIYEQTNEEMLRAYHTQVQTDGRIGFLAAAPAAKGKGIGTLLLRELEKREQGKRIYLFTDDACTYSFYERHMFQRVSEKTVALEFFGKKVPLTCFLYSKCLGDQANTLR